MADSKRISEGLEDKHVEIFLKTPLFQFRYIYDGEERELLDNAVRISGLVISERGAGLFIKVDIISNMKKKEKELPFEQLFIPYSKMDFVVVE